MNSLEKAQLNLYKTSNITKLFGLNRYNHISQIRQALDILPVEMLHLKFIAITLRLMKKHYLTNLLLISIMDFGEHNLSIDAQKEIYMIIFFLIK